MTTTTASDLFDKIEEISPMLRKFAAHHTGTAYAADLADMADEAQDLYQVAVAKIIMLGKQGDTKSYLTNLGDWAMRDAAKAGRVYTKYVGDDGLGEDDEFEIPTTQDEPESMMIEMEMAETVQAICRNLRPEQATIVRLLRDGSGIVEIARKLGVTPQAVRYHQAQIKNIFALHGLTPALALA